MKLSIFIGLFFFVSLFGFAQTNNNIQLALKATNVNGVVKLRWAPTNVALWQLGRDKGFIVEKVRLIENNQLVKNPEVERLTPQPLIPKQEKLEGSVLAKNPKVGVIAQAFWGKSFSTANPKAAASTQVLNSSVDNNIRMSFSLMAADQDFEAALFAGWAFADPKVSKGGYYKYRVKLNALVNGDTVMADINVNMDANYSMPEPFGAKIEFDENLARLSWEHSLNSYYYSAYHVERSVDNKTFTRLNSSPIVVLSSTNENMEVPRGEYIDSIKNDTLYYYRIQGIDCFGQRGPYSKPVSGTAKLKLKCIPEITSVHYVNSDTVTLFWNFEPKEEALIKGFDVLRADSIDGQYSLVSALLPPSSRTFLSKMKPSNYYLVRALGLNDDFTASGVIFVQQPDDIPPHQPEKPQWKVDSTGVVTLWWEPNHDEDIKGYAVYFARINGEEFFPLTVDPLLEPIFRDTIDLNTFIEHVYYQVRAIDKRNNHSVPSDTAIVELPDILAPVAPYFLHYAINADSVNFEWVNSGSEDVVLHQLLRKTKEETNWTEVLRFDTARVDRFTDKGLNESTEYQYFLLATDDDGLKSETTNPLQIRIGTYKRPKPIEKCSASLNRDKKQITLKWEKNNEVEAIQLYKQQDDLAPFLFQLIASTESKITDKEIKPFSNYTYKIRTKGKNGLYSDFTTINVNW